MEATATSLLKLFDDLSATIEKAVASGILNLTDPLIDLLIVLGIISIASNWEMYFSGSFNFGNLFVKIIQIGFFAFLIRNWGMFFTMIKQSGEQLGLFAGGAEETMTSGTLVLKGLGVVFSFLAKVYNGASISLNAILVWLLAILCILIALYAFTKIAYTLFITNMEFVIIGGLSIVLLPFGVLNWTKSISEKTWGILLTCAVKVMVASFMVALLSTFIDNSFDIGSIEVINNNEIKNMLPNLFGSTISMLFIAYLFGQAVEFAGAMTNGLTISSRNLAESGMGMAAGATRNAAGWGVGKLRQQAYKNSGKYRTFSDTWDNVKQHRNHYH
ncbi:MAG: type IV secretion system protein [Dialister invisus]|jgi:type IV secretion system protein TrbL|uniref:type IV secretion system protein n=1 Tax=Dialister invisus TaxID=218538 RepID=UPI002F9566E8